MMVSFTNRHQLLLPLLGTFAIFCSTAVVRADTITGRVVRVIDGDTLVVAEGLSGEGRGAGDDPCPTNLFRVRLAGIDAPEIRQPYGLESKRALEEMVLDAIVVVDWTKRDRYRRVLGWVRAPSFGPEHHTHSQPATVNWQLVAAGHVWHAVRYSRDPEFVAAESDAARDRLGLWATTGRVPPWEFRNSQLQTFVSRSYSVSYSGGSGGLVPRPREGSRQQLRHGSHAEVEIRSSQLGWRGIADLLTISTTTCEIRDFKTGIAREEHECQLRTYALLWARDRELNPHGRLSDRLVLSYQEGDVEVPAPNETLLRSLEDELRKRSALALADLEAAPPDARPSTESCAYCPVRHLCEEYWCWRTPQDSSSKLYNDRFADVQLRLSGQHGPSSWDGVVESGLELRVGGPILVRASNLPFGLHRGQRLRLLNVHISVPNDKSLEDAVPVAVATMGASSEAFLLSKPPAIPTD